MVNASQGMRDKASFIVSVVVAILLVLTLHEYGHFSELRKRGIGVQEFSIGIGPVLYQYQPGPTAYSLRLIPVMAYVLPSDEGEKVFAKIPFKERCIVLSAGVRNNIVADVGGVAVLQMLSLRSGIFSAGYMARQMLLLPVRIAVLYFAFFISFFTQRGSLLFEQFRFPVKTERYYNTHINRFIWWSFAIGFLNCMPLWGLDGAKIFFEALSPHLGTLFAAYTPTAMSIFFFFVMFVGIRVDEVIDYAND